MLMMALDLRQTHCYFPTMIIMMMMSAPILDSDEDKTGARSKSNGAFVGTAPSFESASWTLMIMMVMGDG